MAMLGKEVRMSRLVNPKSNKMMAITVDHAISRGIAPMTGLHHIQDTIDKIILPLSRFTEMFSRWIKRIRR